MLGVCKLGVRDTGGCGYRGMVSLESANTRNNVNRDFGYWGVWLMGVLYAREYGY